MYIFLRRIVGVSNDIIDEVRLGNEVAASVKIRWQAAVVYVGVDVVLRAVQPFCRFDRREDIGAITEQSFDSCVLFFCGHGGDSFRFITNTISQNAAIVQRE